MDEPRPSTAHEDNLFGVCHALGEDFGFNPLLLRVSFGVALLWNPAIVIGTYAVLGVVVAFSRWMVPNPRGRRSADKSVTV